MTTSTFSPNKETILSIFNSEFFQNIAIDGISQSSQALSSYDITKLTQLSDLVILLEQYVNFGTINYSSLSLSTDNIEMFSFLVDQSGE